MSAKPIALEKNKAEINWPIPTATIATYKQNLRSSRKEVLVHLSDPLILKKVGDNRILGEVKDENFKENPRQEQVKASPQVKF